MKPYDVLFLCTGNSARSILAEAYLNSAARGRFKAYSAGSSPAGKVNPFALECDSGAGEVCPVWPGQPMTAHWDVQDPAAVTGPDDEKRKAFLKAFTELATRVDLFLSLPVEKLAPAALKKKLDDIGRI